MSRLSCLRRSYVDCIDVIGSWVTKLYPNYKYSLKAAEVMFVSSVGCDSWPLWLDIFEATQVTWILIKNSIPLSSKSMSVHVWRHVSVFWAKTPRKNIWCLLTRPAPLSPASALLVVVVWDDVTFGWGGRRGRKPVIQMQGGTGPQEATTVHRQNHSLFHSHGAPDDSHERTQKNPKNKKNRMSSVLIEWCKCRTLKLKLG